MIEVKTAGNEFCKQEKNSRNNPFRAFLSRSFYYLFSPFLLSFFQCLLRSFMFLFFIDFFISCFLGCFLSFFRAPPLHIKSFVLRSKSKKKSAQQKYDSPARLYSSVTQDRYRGAAAGKTNELLSGARRSLYHRSVLWQVLGA